jgi:hypothetical protein
MAGCAIEPRDVVDTAGDAPVFVSPLSLGVLAFGVYAYADAAERARRAALLRQLERWPVPDVRCHTVAAFGVLAAPLLSMQAAYRVRASTIGGSRRRQSHGYMLLR